MSAPLGPRASSNNSRGQLYTRPRPRSRGLGRGGSGTGRNAPQSSSDVLMGDAPAGQQSSSGRPRAERGTRRQTSPRRVRGEPRGVGRAGRHVSPGPSRGDGSQQRLKPPASQNNIRNKSWTNPASLNASIQSHAGKVADSRNASWRYRPHEPTYRKQIDDLYQTVCIFFPASTDQKTLIVTFGPRSYLQLKEDRRRERIKAIKDGFLADPAKPTTLDCAITPVGTCQDMCPEFERVERIMQNTVEGMEKMLPFPEAKEKFASENIMVKKFRRSAAGYEEQLPSDIRPPLVLQKTLDYLINDVVGGPEPLAAVHGFVWDRTRSIRNDFSIQQVTKMEDVKIAIDCFERIVRFHILSLHQLSGSGDQSGEFSAQQERTQLNNALLSLHHYYEDNQNTFVSPNEAEFRAYAIIFEIQDLRPDVEDRLQNLPKNILKDQRVQTALKLYSAAGSTADQQGPLQPHTRFLTAQANTGGFWSTVRSNSVSYLMACVTEIYFNHVRRTCLKAVWKAYKGKRAGPTREGDSWMLNDLTTALGFDDEAQSKTFCEQEGFNIVQSENGNSYIDLGSVDAGNFTEHKSQPKPIFSKTLVESKRLGRTLPAVINGMSASQAQAQGFVEELTDGETNSVDNDESLFVDGDSENEQLQSGSESEAPSKRPLNGDAPKLNPTASPFSSFSSPAPGIVPSSSPFPASSFGTLNGTSQAQNPKAESGNPSDFDSGLPTQSTSTPFGVKEPPKFNFFAPATLNQTQEAKTSSNTLSNKEPLSFSFGAVTSQASDNNSIGFLSSVQTPGPKPSVLDRPPSTTSGLFPAQQQTVTPTQPPTPSASTASQPAKSLFEKPSVTSASPGFSFGTSPLFQPIPKDQIPTPTNIQSSPQQKDLTNKSVLFPTVDPSNPLTFPSHATTKPTVEPPSASPYITSNPGVAPVSTFFKPDGFTISEPQQPASSSQRPATEGVDQPRLDSDSLPAQSTPTYQQPSKRDLFQRISPATSKPTSPGSFTAANSVTGLSDSTAAGSTQGSFQRDPATSSSNLPDLRSVTLDKLADALMLGDQGLLQQFLEFSVGPIIDSSIKQLEDEDSWEEARECRVMLLSKKYLKRWKANAWSMSLTRKARERRRNFAKSIQDSARSTPSKGKDMVDSFRSTATGSKSSLPRLNNSTSMMPPASTPFQTRQNFDTVIDDNHSRSEAGKGTKRKRNISVSGDTNRTPKSTKIGHRRSETLGNSIMSAPPRGFSHNTYKPRIDISTVPEGSMLNDILMKQARRLAPTAKSDTTRTDYFRLKALGIDPDTPIVPLGKKRTRAESLTNGDSKLMETAAHEGQPRGGPESRPIALTPAAPATPATTRGAAKSDDDEALFAEIRSVREALAESEQWMQSERESIERSTASKQVSMSPPNLETPAQRRLREIKERGHQPSRTELRLRAMGDRALLPEGFWDGEGMGLSLMKGKGKGKEEGTAEQFGRQRPNGNVQQRPDGLMGFAALGQRNGVIPRRQEFQRQDSEEEARKGGSADDAIEL